MMRPSVSFFCFLVFNLLLIGSFGEDAASRNKYINVGVVSNWGATPLHMEASEYFAENELFYEFITSKIDGDTPEKLYKKSLEVAENLLDSTRVQLLKLALSMRTYSPKIEMFRQLPKMEEDVVKNIHVRIGSSVYTSSTDLEKALASYTPDSSNTQQVFEFDHVFPTSHNHTHHAILYADFAVNSFAPFHSVLSQAAEKGKIGYVLRHLVPESETKIHLQGWGVDLAMKNVEYKAMDDSKVAKGEESATVSQVEEDEEIAGFKIGVLKKRKPNLVQQLDDFGTYLMGKESKVDELNVWDFKDMGLQAAQKIVTGADPLRSLRDISQNFPTLANSLTRLKQNRTLKSDIEYNQQIVNGGDNMVLLNGRIVDSESLDAFAFLDVLKEELSKVSAFQKLKMSFSTALPFLAAPLPDKANLRFKIDSDAIIFANDLERDENYGRWPRSASDILRRVHPGQMRFVAKNFFTIVLVADFATDAALDSVSTLFNYVNQNLPARVGILPLYQKGEASEDVAKILTYICASKPPKLAFRFLSSFSQAVARPITKDSVHAAYTQIAGHFGLEGLTAALESTAAQERSEKLKIFADGMGLDSHQMFVNGFLADPNKEILDAISEAMFDQTPFLQNEVQQGRIHDGTNINEYLMNPPALSEAPTVVKRFNKLIPPSETNPLQFVNLVGAGPMPKSGNWDSLALLDKTSRVLSELSYFQVNKDETMKFSQIVIADTKTKAGAQLALEALKFVEDSKRSRVTFILNPEKLPKSKEDFESNFKFEEAIIKAGSNLGVVKALLEAAQSESSLTADAIDKIVEENRKGKKLPQIAGEPFDRMAQHAWWAAHGAGVAQGSNAVIINGRKLKIAEPFFAHDFEFLELFQEMRYGKSIETLLNDPKFEGVDSDDLTSSFLSTVAMQATSILGLDEQAGIKRKTFPNLRISAELSTSPEPVLHVLALLNPLSKASQKISPVLITLRKLFATKISIILNPQLQLSDLPLKRYYNYVFNDDMHFDENGQVAQGNTATISQLPLSRILTLGMDTPEAWLVQPIIARYDLDNIKLEDLGEEKVLTAIFELEYILVEGKCYDFTNVQWGMPTPPRGLELVLQHTDPNWPSVDTLVMSNFGYFQLKANPGLWKLKLAEGRGSKIFSIMPESGQEAPSFRWVVVSSFLGEEIVLKVSRNEGMNNEQLLLTEEEEKQNNAWGSISGLWKGKEDASSETTTLHIFSVASGHLYERLTRIMILSVLKGTKNPVKFWFLKNYMSPKFKEILPHMALQYNFSYELVTYKWPTWLRKQTEKQRIIWAYKILFLDVLFPLQVKKIIFVDSDQVVRTDLMELYNMDLEGAPLAYTPFCNNKPEMDGFRFWKQGYWKDHLRGRPYHISALYVIDLQQFRRTAAGDQLRSTYDMLSRDPNSLANLDQDLPNYLQHQVKIHSLPQEWLWCETWCPEETKTTAKTIDLCNNPLTKASKLENAVRILGDEWTSLDNEVKDLEQRIAQNKSSSSSPSPSSPSSSHPHASHVTHDEISSEKMKQAFDKLRN